MPSTPPPFSPPTIRIKKKTEKRLMKTGVEILFKPQTVFDNDGYSKFGSSFMTKDISLILIFGRNISLAK